MKVPSACCSRCVGLPMWRHSPHACTGLCLVAVCWGIWAVHVSIAACTHRLPAGPGIVQAGCRCTLCCDCCLACRNHQHLVLQLPPLAVGLQQHSTVLVGVYHRCRLFAATRPPACSGSVHVSLCPLQPPASSRLSRWLCHAVIPALCGCMNRPLPSATAPRLPLQWFVSHSPGFAGGPPAGAPATLVACADVLRVCLLGRLWVWV